MYRPKTVIAPFIVSQRNTVVSFYKINNIIIANKKYKFCTNLAVKQLVD